MKMIGKKIYDYLRGVKGIALILYMQFIICADIRLSVTEPRSRWMLYIAVFVALLIFCPALMRFVSRLSIRLKPVLTTRRSKVIWFTVFLLVSAAVFGFYYAAYSPGAFSADSMTQYKQAITGEYNNWHPVLHTLLFFKLPLTISGGNAGFIVLFQLILFSIAAAYAAYTMLRHSNPIYASLSLAFILFNPVTCYVALYPWKDVAFAITALTAAAYAANIFFSKGVWLKKPLNSIAAVAVLVLATVFRHNALLFTVPMLIALVIYLNRKMALITVVCFIAAVVLIEGPFYAMLKVEKPGDRQEEMLGVPVAVIGEVAGHRPQALDDASRKFIYEVAPYSTWAHQYQIGNFNTVKFYPGTNYHRIEEEGAFKVIGHMLRCFVKAPKESFTALIAATDMVYTVGYDSLSWDIRPYVISNEYGIKYQGSEKALAAVQWMQERLNTLFKWLNWYVGAMNLILIVAMLSKLRFRKKEGWKRILPALSMLLYNFGTMLLLSGDEIRIFYFSFVITPVLLLIVMRDDKDDLGFEDHIIPAKAERSIKQLFVRKKKIVSYDNDQ